MEGAVGECHPPFQAQRRQPPHDPRVRRVRRARRRCIRRAGPIRRREPCGAGGAGGRRSRARAGRGRADHTPVRGRRARGGEVARRGRRRGGRCAARPRRGRRGRAQERHRGVGGGGGGGSSRAGRRASGTPLRGCRWCTAGRLDAARAAAQAGVLGRAMDGVGEPGAEHQGGRVAGSGGAVTGRLFPWYWHGREGVRGFAAAKDWSWGNAELRMALEEGADSDWLVRTVL